MWRVSRVQGCVRVWGCGLCSVSEWLGFRKVFVSAGACQVVCSACLCVPACVCPAFMQSLPRTLSLSLTHTLFFLSSPTPPPHTTPRPVVSPSNCAQTPLNTPPLLYCMCVRATAVATCSWAGQTCACLSCTPLTTRPFFLLHALCVFAAVFAVDSWAGQTCACPLCTQCHGRSVSQPVR